MEFIADLCKEFDALCFTDEIYEHIIFSVDGCSAGRSHLDGDAAGNARAHRSG
jgi:aspartate/methionine/tyrosine aminotransferase